MTSHILARTTLFVITLTATAFLENLRIPTHVIAAKAQDEERELVNQIPKHIPLAIKIKKEKEKDSKDLRNEHWAHDFELEVTNTGPKPIYFFHLMIFQDVRDLAGQEVAATIIYGRPEIGDIRVLPSPQDVPINPGESTFVKIHPGTVEAWDKRRQNEGRELPKRIRVMFQFLSFGDHTGYAAFEGVPIPQKPISESNSSRSSPVQNEAQSEAPQWLTYKT